MKLIDNWKAAHKWASVRLAMLAGLAVAYFAAYPDQWQAVLATIPEPLRPWFGLMVFAVAGGSRVVTFARPASGEQSLPSDH